MQIKTKGFWEPHLTSLQIYEPIQSLIFYDKVHIFWEGYKNMKKIFLWLLVNSNRIWRFRHIPWPSQNTWTLCISKKILTSVGGRLDYGSHFDIINIYVGVGGSFLLHFVKGCREDQFVGYYMSRNDVGYDKFLFQILYLRNRIHQSWLLTFCYRF